MPGEEEESCRVLWRRGKGVRFRGPYTTWTSFGPFTRFVAAVLPTAGPLFPDVRTDAQRAKAMRALLSDLRRTAPGLECRSLRRGSLQTLAQMGLPTEVLLTFSGHRSAATLYRYLGWGSEHHANRQQALTGSHSLWSGVRVAATTSAAPLQPTSA
jgi:hypothetical protein